MKILYAPKIACTIACACNFDENCMCMSFFYFSKHFMMGVYQLVWTSVTMSRELMNKISLWNPFFEERKLGSFFLCIFWEILCIYISGLQLQNIHPKTLKKIRESYNTYSHGILSWEKWFSKISEKRLRLVLTFADHVPSQLCSSCMERRERRGKIIK